MRDARVAVAHDRGDERPVPRVVEVRARPARRRAVADERDHVIGEDRLAGVVLHVEADVRVAAALVRRVMIELAPALPSRGDRPTAPRPGTACGRSSRRGR